MATADVATRKSRREMVDGVTIAELEPWERADDIAAHHHRLEQELRRAGIPQQPFLREGHDLNVDERPELFAQLQHRLYRRQAADRPDVGERAKRRRPVHDRLLQHSRAPCQEVLARIPATRIERQLDRLLKRAPGARG